MTDITITANNVDAGTDGKIGVGIAGAVITAGQLIYLDKTTNTYLLADADAIASAKVAGVATAGAQIGQNVAFQEDGTYTAGGTTVAGTAYYVSKTAGGIAPEADVTAGAYKSLFGFGFTGNKIRICRQWTGIVQA